MSAAPGSSGTESRERQDRRKYIVTGADSTHGRSLVQLLQSIALHESNTRVVVYDLGLDPEQLFAVRDTLINGSVERFPYNEYPAFFDIKVNAGNYAWKPAIIAREIRKSPSPVCWMDAGNIVVKPLMALRAAIRDTGYYLPSSAGTVARWTHPAMLSALAIPADRFGARPNLNAASVAFDPMLPAIRRFIFQWADLAKKREVIGPESSNLSNHRYDQALLTVLAYQACILERPSAMVDELLIHRDVERRRRLPASNI